MDRKGIVFDQKINGEWTYIGNSKKLKQGYKVRKYKKKSNQLFLIKK